MSLLSLPLPLLETLTTHLNPADVRALRLLNRTAFTTFSSPAYCQFLLEHFFPLSPLTVDPTPTAYDAFNALCSRLNRLHSQNWTQTLDLVFPPTAASIERVYPGYHAFCPSSGALITVDSSLEHRTLEISVRWLGGAGDADGRCIVIPAPLELAGLPREDTGSPVGGWMPRCPPDILFRDGRVLLVYPRDSFGGLVKEGLGSLALLLDAQADGRTVWSALFNSPIFMGIHEDTPDACSTNGEKRLAPVFNRYYIAFLTSNTTSGTLAIARLPPESAPATPPADVPETISSSLPIRPENLHSIRADRLGKWVLAGEVFPATANLHRVVLISAISGTAVRAFHVPMAPAFAASPRDWGYQLAPTEDSLLTFASPRNSGYRQHLSGQISIFPLDGSRAKVRYLLAPAPGIMPPEAYDAQARWDCEINLLSLVCQKRVWLISYIDLALDSAKAGSGELANRYNSRPPRFLTPLDPPPAPVLPELEPRQVEVGSTWAYLRSLIPSSGEEAVHLLRLTPVGPQSMLTPELPRIGSRSSFRSASGLSGMSSPLSVRDLPLGAQHQTVVDAEELAARLKAMAVDPNHRRRVVGEREKGDVAWEAGGFEAAGGMGGSVIAPGRGGSGFTESWGEARERGSRVKESVVEVIRRAKSEKVRRRRKSEGGDSVLDYTAADNSSVDEVPPIPEEFAGFNTAAGFASVDAHGNGHGNGMNGGGDDEHAHEAPPRRRSVMGRSRSYDTEGVWSWLRRGRSSKHKGN